MKRCIVAGAGGLIGSHLLPLLAREWNVHAVSRHRPRGLDDPTVVWHHIDVSRGLDRTTLPESVDAVVYLAQSEHFREFPERALDIFEVNTVALLRFLEFAWKAGARNFVYASSGGVYGSGDVRMSEETDIPAKGDLGFYLSTKICSEILAQNYSRYFNVAILRYFFVYGRGQRESMLVPRLIQRVREGQPILLQGEDGIRTNPTHVSDAVAATKRALELTSSHTINIGGPEVLSMREIGNLIGKAVGRKPVFSVDRNASPRHLSGDIAKMRDFLVPPSTRFAEGLQTML